MSINVDIYEFLCVYKVKYESSVNCLRRMYVPLHRIEQIYMNRFTGLSVCFNNKTIYNDNSVIFIPNHAIIITAVNCGSFADAYNLDRSLARSLSRRISAPTKLF